MMIALNNIKKGIPSGINLKNKTKFILGKNLKKGRLPLTPNKNQNLTT